MSKNKYYFHYYFHYLVGLSFLFSACLAPKSSEEVPSYSPSNKQESLSLSDKEKKPFELLNPQDSFKKRQSKAAQIVKDKVVLASRDEFKQLNDFFCHVVSTSNPSDPNWSLTQSDAMIDLGTLLCNHQSQPKFHTTMCTNTVFKYFDQHLFNLRAERAAGWAAYSTFRSILKCHSQANVVLAPVTDRFISGHKELKPAEQDLYLALLMSMCQAQTITLKHKEQLNAILPHYQKIRDGKRLQNCLKKSAKSTL